MEPFTGFQDFVETFPIHRGKVKGNEQPTTVGEYKVRMHSRSYKTIE